MNFSATFVECADPGLVGGWLSTVLRWWIVMTILGLLGKLASSLVYLLRLEDTLWSK